MLLDQPLVLEPLEPPARGLDPAARIGPEGQGGHQTGDPVRVPGGLAVVDRELRQPLALVPAGRPLVQLSHELGLAALQLGQEELAEQLVVAVPAVTVVGLGQEVRAGQRLQHPVGAADLEDRVAQWP